MDMIPNLNHHTNGALPSSTFASAGEPSAAASIPGINAFVTKIEQALGVAPTNVHELEPKIYLSILDSLPSHGPISALAFSLGHNGDKPVPELVSSTGVGKLGGFTLWQSTLPIYVKRKIHAICGTRGVWSLAVKQPISSSGGGSSSKGIGRGGAARGGGGNEDERWDTVLIGTDGVPSPGLSRVSLFFSLGVLVLLSPAVVG
jgi:cleavage and polyadenylation specificity factor subunit 1